MQLQQTSQQSQIQQMQLEQQAQLPQHQQAQLQQVSQQQAQLQKITQQQTQPQQVAQQQTQLQQTQQQVQLQQVTQQQTQLQSVPSQQQAPQQVQLQQVQLHQVSSQQVQLQQVSSQQNQMQQTSGQQVQMQQVSSQSDLQQSHPTQVQMSTAQPAQVQISSRDLSHQSIQNAVQQQSLQMQLHSASVQAQLQKVQLQRAQQLATHQNQLQQTASQQVLLKQVSQAQLPQSLASVSQGATQSGNQQINLQQASLHQVQLHVLQQARIQQLRQQQALLQQSITQIPTSASQQLSSNNSQQPVAVQQASSLQSSIPQLQLQQSINQTARPNLQSSQTGSQSPNVQLNAQQARLQSPLQQTQLQQLALQQQLQKSSVGQNVLQPNQLQSQLQQIQLRQAAALQQARLQQSANASAQQIIQQGQLARSQPSPGQTQVITKQIQLQQPSSQVLQQQAPQQPPSPQLQQGQRFPHQLTSALRPVQKQFAAGIPNTANQPAMHGQPPVQGLHQQQLLQQRQMQQQLALQQLRQRQLQQSQPQQPLQNTQQSPQQAVQQILAGQPPVMMKPPPQYPYDRQQLQGQPRLQYPSHPRQLSPQQQQAQHPRAPWQQVPNNQFLRRSPGVANPPPSPQWQHAQQQSPKSELTPSPQPPQTPTPVAWQQRQQLQGPEVRDTTTPAPQPPAQQATWSQNQQTQLPQQREPTQAVPAAQLIQWQQLKQMEIRRQQLLQQPTAVQRPVSQTQLSVQVEQSAQRINVPNQSQQTLAVPAQYQPQNAPSILSQTSPGSVAHGTAAAAQVTPKTKTALANLLNTRLQTTGRAVDGSECNQAVIRTTQVLSQPTQTVSRRPSAESMSVIHPLGQIPDRNIVPPIPQVVFYGHDPKINVPPDLCLLGCTFFIEDYKTVEEDKISGWKEIIKLYGGEVEDTYSNKCTHVICENQKNPIVQQALREGKRCITAFWLNDVLEKKKMKYPWLPHHFPTPFSEEKPCRDQIITITNFEPEERIILKNIIETLGAKYTGYMTSQNSVVICKKKEGKKVLKAKAWRIPVVNAQWLHDLMFGLDGLKLPMAHKYQQFDVDNPFAVEYSAISSLMAGWKVPIKINEEIIKKHSLNESKENTPSDKLDAQTKDNGKRELEEKSEPESKRTRVESPPVEENIPLTTQNPPDVENKPRVLFTGLISIKDFAKVVCQLGGCLAKSATECTHLVADKYARTVKFLCAIHVAKYVITTEWLLESEKQNQFVDEEPYTLQDPESEKTYGFSLLKTLKRSSRTPIFKDFVFYVTPGVFPKPDVLKHIIEAGGGIPVFKKAPSLKQVAAMEQNERKFVIITCENDLHLCKMYLEKQISVQNVEFILTGTIRQDLDFESFAYH